MSKPPLPRRTDLRKFAASGARVAGAVPLAEMTRLSAVLFAVDGSAEVELLGSIGADGYRLVMGDIKATLTLQCQRCLEAMSHEVDARVALALVWKEEEISALPARLDGLVVGSDPYDLYDLVEEELLLELPLAPRHETACRMSGFEPAAVEFEEPSPGPFSVLAEIKGGSR